jgi:hypothetical protein
VQGAEAVEHIGAYPEVQLAKTRAHFAQLQAQPLAERVAR